MIRALKGMLALVALAGLGLGLRWTTAGSFGAANSHDLDSMAVLAVGTVAWMAYGWLVLAVLATVLEQLPGAIGAVGSALAGRITSRTSHALLRSALGVAAATPLTVSVAHAASPDASNWRATEPRSSVLTGAVGVPHSSGAQVGASTRAAEPDGTRVRVGVPDRPTTGAPTRYTDLRSGQPVRLAGRVVVKPGDTLWSIAAAELGPNADHSAIAARWPAWYAANRQQIGPDPDLILPGQVLRTPAAAPGHPTPPTHQEN
ncbi:LysM peptidoglycan-binding domain-containing protein [Kribbella antiqua]|nr:LysM peptidoglycan-binding domain-containing protein [Kribbella antiqua]